MSVFVRCAQNSPFGTQERRSSRLEAVLRAGQAHLAATTVPTGMPPPQPPPLRVTDLPAEVAQHVTKQLAALNAGNATSVCSDLKAWCRAHPVACRDNDTIWRVAFEALFIPPLPPAPPAPPPMPTKPRESDFGIPERSPAPKPPDDDLSFQLDEYGDDSPADSESDSDDDGPSLPQPGGEWAAFQEARHQREILGDSMFDSQGGLPVAETMSDEEKEKLSRYSEAMMQYSEAKDQYDRAVKKAQGYADAVEAGNAARAALDADPPESYKDAFVDVCARIDRVKAGQYRAIEGVHSALRRSEYFLESVAVIDARVIYYGIGFNREDDEAMWRSAIESNPRNMAHATIYSYGGVGNISEEEAQDILDDGYPEILQHMPAEYDLDIVDWNLIDLLEEHPLWLEYMQDMQFTDDECLMLKLAKKDGRSLEFMSDSYRSDKRIVLAALEQASETGADVYKHVMGAALRRDPDVRIAAGLKPWPGQRRVRRNREEEESCTDDSGSEAEEEPEEYDPNQSPARAGQDAPMLPADYMLAGPPKGEWSDDDDDARVKPAPSLRRIERELAEYEATSSDEEDPESPTSTFDIKLKARNKDDSSSEEEDVSHDMDAGNVMMDYD